MSDVTRFIVPDGYQVVFTTEAGEVACDRGCGWTLPVGTISGMPTEVRDQLFPYHDAGTPKQHATNCRGREAEGQGGRQT